MCGVIRHNDRSVGTTLDNIGEGLQLDFRLVVLFVVATNAIFGQDRFDFALVFEIECEARALGWYQIRCNRNQGELVEGKKHRAVHSRSHSVFVEICNVIVLLVQSALMDGAGREVPGLQEPKLLGIVYQ